MPNEISQRYISDVLDNCGLNSQIDDDCDLVVIMHADSNFGYNVQIYYTVEDNKWLRVMGVAPDFDSRCYNKQRVLDAINAYNRNQRMVKAYLHSNGRRVVCERYELIDEYVSEDYIKNNCIKKNTARIWQAFVMIGRDL